MYTINMELIWNDLTVDFSHISPKRLIEDWTWLTGENMKPVLISSIGDMFLAAPDGKVHWLNVGEGKLEPVAKHFDELKEKMKCDEADEWFMPFLVREIKNSGLELCDGKLYGYKKLPIIGGEYNVDNFELTDIEVHFSFAGQIHKQIKDLPDGTKVNIKLA